MSGKKTKSRAEDIDYKTYLRLPDILNAQHPISGDGGKKPAAHDEMMFIVVHQTYEIWFKLVLFEMDRIQKIFAHKTVADSSLRTVAASLGRIVEIMKLLTRQLDIIETMTPLDFLDFRHVFRTASGFQSLQFRELEVRLGLRAEDRIGYNGRPYESYLAEDDRRYLRKITKAPSLLEQLDQWLSRTPFIQMGRFDFWAVYRKAVMDMIAGDRKHIVANKKIAPAAKEAELGKLKNMEAQFDLLFTGKSSPSPWRFSMKALQAALFINLYRDQPVLQQPFRILSDLMDLDELMALWRYRHALMAQRMLGAKMGSGGSSGHDYLAMTAQKHRIFGDLFSLSTFLIPRSRLPELPAAVAEKMGFRYWSGEKDAT